MLGSLRIFVLLAAIFAPALAIAQSDDAGEAPSEGQSDETLADGLSTGTPVDDGIGDIEVRGEFSDWQLRCVKTEDGSDPCQLYQLLKDENGNSVAEFNLFPLPAGQRAEAGANVITPLETLLTANLRLAVDGGQTKQYPYSFCSQIGCFSRLGLTAEEVSLFRKGSKATITIVPAAAPNATVELTLSLSGFTAGYKALLEAVPVAASE